MTGRTLSLSCCDNTSACSHVNDAKDDETMTQTTASSQEREKAGGGGGWGGGRYGRRRGPQSQNALYRPVIAVRDTHALVREVRALDT